VTNRPPHPCVPPIWKIFGKSTLKATVDLTVPKWCLVIHGALWCEKGGRESSPSPLGRGPTGMAPGSLNIIEFTDRDTASRSQRATLAAMYAIAGTS
jgi:hypothetical protein